jgi:hypothetical protein
LGCGCVSGWRGQDAELCGDLAARVGDDDVAELVPLLRRDRPLRFLRADGDQLDPSLGEDGYKLGLIGS